MDRAGSAANRRCGDADAVTPMPGLVVPFVTFMLLYAVLSVIVVTLLAQLIVRSPGSAARARET